MGRSHIIKIATIQLKSRQNEVIKSAYKYLSKTFRALLIWKLVRCVGRLLIRKSNVGLSQVGIPFYFYDKYLLLWKILLNY